ncbi:MAG: flagellar hook protein FlgE [Aeromonas sobria]
MSFSIAISGLNATSSNLTTISNNIANAGTVGYLGGRTTFSALYSAGQPGGVAVNQSTQNFSALGSSSFTGRDLDMAITGTGFFITKGTDGVVSYTRAGIFQQDKNGYVVDQLGNRLQGNPVDDKGNIMQGTLGDLYMQSGSMPPKASDSIQLGVNLNKDEVAITEPLDTLDPTSYHASNSTNVYDSLGSKHTLTQYYTKTSDGTWRVDVYMDGKDLAQPQTLNFDSDGKLVSGGKFTLDLPAAELDGASAMTLSVDMRKASQFAAPFSNQVNSANGYAPGEQTGVMVDETGALFATYSNGEKMLQGQLVLANFANPEGLAVADNTRWTATTASGEPLLGIPGAGIFGGIQSQSLQLSNVDVTTEMVGLIEAQRNYQANSKVISTMSQLNQALMNAI